MKWDETNSYVARLGRDLKQCIMSFRAIEEKGGVSSNKQVMSSASERYNVLKTVHARVSNRMDRLIMFLGVDPTKYKVIQSVLITIFITILMLSNID